MSDEAAPSAMERRLMRRINDNHARVLDDLAEHRDNMTVQTAILMRVEGSLSALTTEIRAMHSRHARLTARVDRLEKPDGGEAE